MIDDTPFAITVDGEAYIAADGLKKLADGIGSIKSTAGGAYLIPDEESETLHYFNAETGRVTTICESVTNIVWAGGIQYVPPVTGEQKAQLQKLYLEAKKCVETLESGEYLSGWAQNSELAASLLGRNDVPSYLDNMLMNFSSGYYFAGMILKTQPSEADDLATDTAQSAIQSLNNAIEEYEERFGLEIDI